MYFCEPFLLHCVTLSDYVVMYHKPPVYMFNHNISSDVRNFNYCLSTVHFLLDDFMLYIDSG